MRRCIEAKTTDGHDFVHHIQSSSTTSLAPTDAFFTFMALGSVKLLAIHKVTPISLRYRVTVMKRF